jgi:hypothetical protein
MLDADGGLTWARRYGGGDFPSLESVAFTRDGGLLLAGSIGMATPEDGLVPCAWIVRTDSEGMSPGHVPESDFQLPPIRFEDRILAPLGWVVACGAFEDEESALFFSSRMSALTCIESGALWIPDWPSLSGSEAWLSYIGPVYPHDSRLTEYLTAIRNEAPEAYMIWVGGCSARVTMSLEEAALP